MAQLAEVHERTKRRRILLLLSDLDLVSVLRDFLSGEGFTVREPEADSDAAQLIQRGEVDLVVAESRRWGELSRPGLRPVAVLLLAEMDEGVLARGRGLRSLSKPVSLRTLGQTLRELAQE